MKQDIYGVLSDDQKGVRGSTSSTMGKVNKVTTWVNTDRHGEATLTFVYDKEADKIRVFGELPPNWDNQIKNQKSPSERIGEFQQNNSGMMMVKLGSLI